MTAAAGANLAAVNYHFGSKAALLEAVVERILGPATKRQLARLDALEQEQEEPSVEELLEAFVVPIFDVFNEGGARGPVLAQLFGRVMGDPGDEMRRIIISIVDEADRRYRAAFARVLRHLSAAEGWWRFRSMVALAVSHHVHQARMLEALPAEKLPPEARESAPEDRLAWMLTFLAGALLAPATEAGVDHSRVAAGAA